MQVLQALCAIARVVFIKDSINSMFTQHNVLSVLVCSIVLLNAAIALVYSGNIFTGLINYSSWEETAYWLVTAVAIGLSIYGGVLVALKRLVGLRICFWAYIIQLFGVITESYNFVIVFGLNVSTSTDLGILLDLEGISFEFNLIALLVVVLTGISFSSLKKDQSGIHCT